MSMFQVGDVVVCVNAKPDKEDPLADMLVERKIYRVAVTGIRKDGVTAIGFKCHLTGPKSAYGFSAHRFRKVKKASKTFAAQMRACRPAHRKTPAPAA